MTPQPSVDMTVSLAEPDDEEHDDRGYGQPCRGLGDPLHAVQQGLDHQQVEVTPGEPGVLEQRRLVVAGAFVVPPPRLMERGRLRVDEGVLAAGTLGRLLACGTSTLRDRLQGSERGQC